MKKSILLNEDEKNRILNLHETAKNLYENKKPISQIKESNSKKENMKKVIKLTESDLEKIVRRVIKESMGVAFGEEQNGFRYKKENMEQVSSNQDSVVPTAQEKLVNYKYSLPFKVDQNIFPTQDSFDLMVGFMGNIPAFKTIENTILTTCGNGKCLNSFLQSPLGKSEVQKMPENTVDRVTVTNNTLFPQLVAAAIVSSIRGGRYNPNAASENFNFLKLNTNSLGGALPKITGDMFKSAVNGTIASVKSGEFKKYQPSAGVKIG